MRFPRSVRRATALATALLALAALLPAAPAAASTPAAAPHPAAPTASLDYQLDRCGLYGDADLGTASRMVVKQTRANGTQVLSRTVTVADGHWTVECPAPLLRSGDRLQFFLKGSSTPFRTLKLPKLQFRLDRAAKELRGAVPGSYDTLTVDLYRCDPPDEACALQVSPPIDPAPTTGAFRVPIIGLDGLWAGHMTWERGADRIFWNIHADQLLVQPGSATATVIGSKVGARVTVTVRRGTKTGSGTGIYKGGDLKVVIRRNGVPMKVQVGDVVTADLGPDTKLIVPPNNVYLTDTTIAGRCFKSGEVTWVVVDSDGTWLSNGTVAAESVDGTWSDTATAAPGNRLEAYCANLKGDVLLSTASVP